jgi:hypothetical protein
MLRFLTAYSKERLAKIRLKPCQGVRRKMPKKVSRLEIDRWRELKADGMTYQQIGKSTGWQGRTVRQHLEGDFETNEALDVRMDLFKERLGFHWDQLISTVVDSLDTARVPDVRELVRFAATTGSSKESLNNLIVTLRGEDYSVACAARDSRQWALLQQHSSADPLWAAVRTWESAIEDSLAFARRLHSTIEDGLREATQLDVVVQVTNESALARQCVLTIGSESLLRALDLPFRDFREDDFDESSRGQIKVRDVGVVAKAPGRVDEIRGLIVDSIAAYAEFDAVGELTLAYTAALRAEKNLRDTTADLRMMPYLPGVCSVCGRLGL